MQKLVVAIVVGGAACLLAAMAACKTEGPPCYEGDFIACTCANGARGYAACQPSEGLYVPCICDGATPGAKPSDAAASSDGSADAAPTKRGFLEPCATNEECTSGLCQEYPNKGARLCSKPCTQATVATDCPPPSTGCTTKGICKGP